MPQHKSAADIHCFVQAKFHSTEIVKSDSKFAIYDGHSSFRGEVEYLGEMIIVKVFETTLGDT